MFTSYIMHDYVCILLHRVKFYIRHIEIRMITSNNFNAIHDISNHIYVNFGWIEHETLHHQSPSRANKSHAV